LRKIHLAPAPFSRSRHGDTKGFQIPMSKTAIHFGLLSVRFVA
jgi:hypothetical protein